MKKRLLIFCLSSVAMVGVVFFVFGSREPSYQGHRLSYWLEPPKRGSGVKGSDSVMAVRRMGTKAVPFLMRDLKAEDSAFSLFYRTNWPRFPLWIRKKIPEPRTGEARKGTAILALGWLGPAAQTAVPGLIEVLQETKLPIGSRSGMLSPAYNNRIFLRHRLFETLATIGGTNQNLIPALIEGARESEQQWFQAPLAIWFQTDALMAASQQSIPLLMEGLSDSNARVQEFCVRALGLIAPQRTEVISALIQKLGDPDPGMGELAVQTLARAGQKTEAVATETIRSIKEEGTNHLKIRLLADIGPRAVAALPILGGLLKTNGLVQYEAARGLWTIGQQSEAILPFWIEDLQKQGDTGRWQALTLIEKVGGKAKPALSAVIRCLGEDESNRIRAKAAMALGEIGSDATEVITALDAAKKDEYLNVRDAASDAMRKLVPSSITPPAVH